jgi:MEMO1 family protein
MTTKIRHPYVAGRFYPGTKKEIQELIELLKASEIPKIDYSLSSREIYGAIVPHAGHIYSGYQTVHFFEILKQSKQVFDTFIILHPIHRGVAPDYAIDASDKWSTPLGEVDLDREFIERTCIPISTEQQKWEHSAEVILPFMQYFIPYPFKIVPIGISHQTPVVAKEISNFIKIAIKQTGRKICLLASSDFCHYVPPNYGKTMDQMVIDKILEKDAEGIFNVIRKNDITVCGYGPIMCLVETAKDLYKDLKISILTRGNSGQVHPSESVVDYVSILFHG